MLSCSLNVLKNEFAGSQLDLFICELLWHEWDSAITTFLKYPDSKLCWYCISREIYPNIAF